MIFRLAVNRIGATGGGWLIALALKIAIHRILGNVDTAAILENLDVATYPVSGSLQRALIGLKLDIAIDLDQINIGRAALFELNTAIHARIAGHIDRGGSFGLHIPIDPHLLGVQRAICLHHNVPLDNRAIQLAGRVRGHADIIHRGYPQ